MTKFRSNYEKYIGFIKYLSRKISKIYCNSYLNSDDYQQIGLIAMLKAQDGWKEELGTFRTYLCACIYYAMRTEAIKSMGSFSSSYRDKLFALKIKHFLNEGKTEEEVITLLDISYENFNNLKNIYIGSRSLLDINNICTEDEIIPLFEIEDLLSEEENDLFLSKLYNNKINIGRTKKCRTLKRISNKLKDII